MAKLKKYWTSLSRSTHKISPFLFPREVQMILKIAFVEIMDLFTYFAE